MSTLSMYLNKLNFVFIFILKKIYKYHQNSVLKAVIFGTAGERMFLYVKFYSLNLHVQSSLNLFIICSLLSRRMMFVGDFD